MGSDKTKDKDASDSEQPQFRLYLPEYQIAKVPVTNGQYKQFVDATGYNSPAHWAEREIPNGKANHPVVEVSWHDVMAFCAWAKVRLPTEAEWEKAARGPSTNSANVRIYPWGNQAPDETLCNFNRNVGDTTTVGEYPTSASPDASPYGCLDMAGNVWEWTSTKWVDNYANYVDVVDNSMEGDERRVLRGGSWFNHSKDARTAYRGGYAPSEYSDSVGARVVAFPDNSGASAHSHSSL